MKRMIVLCSLALSLTAGSAMADQLLGIRPTVKGAIPISTLLDHPEQYVGKEIKIEGIATDVCPKRGCWMRIQSDRKKESLLIKVNDGEMVFPMSAKGKNLVLQGKLFKKMMSKEEVIEIEKARATKMGKKFDPASVTGPRPVYSFQPSGVVIP